MSLKDLSSVRDSTDQLVQDVQYYNPKPMILHGYFLPFTILQGIWFYFFYIIEDKTFSDEIWIAISLIICLIQIVSVLSMFWSVHCYCFLVYKKVKSINDAAFAKVIPTANNGSAEIVKLFREKSVDDNLTIWFLFQKTKYVYDIESDCFKQLSFPVDLPIESYQKWNGFSDEKQLERASKIYFKNLLTMDIPEFWELFKERATAPFFVFQVFCVFLWCFDDFWYYSLFTLTMLICFESVLVTQQLKNMAEIRKMGNKPFQLLVYRNHKWRPILSSELLPGDIVSVGRSQNDNPVPCDLLLLRGSCIVDESMLTGESVPQMKEPIENLNEKRNFNLDTDGRLHVLYGGTKILQHTSPVKNTVNLRATDNGCVCYVLRTGFQTSQGRLLRTILYSVQRVTANNVETFGFICFLLIFAIAAASYVWIHASEDPKRSKYKLMLECALILTSVVPPELPIELSLAVNSSLASLIRLDIFCTEPFRIPFAGKVDICCFDKTGTLTSNDLIVEGIAAIDPKNIKEIVPVQKAPTKTIQVLATCHSLVFLDEGLVGDPLEKSTLKAIDWSLTRGDTVVPKKGKQTGLKIFHRNHFSSSLKRMSTIAGYQNSQLGESTFFASVKGAPEVLKPMFADIPSDYEKVYLEMSRKGARVLALGWKELGSFSPSEIRNITREEVEKDLEFVGFLIISCPLKPDSKQIMKEIINSSHYVTMITGDAPLTACHVAKELHFVTGKNQTLILHSDSDELNWRSIDESLRLPLIPENEKDFFKNYEFCVTGDSLNSLLDTNSEFLLKILPKIRIFARVAPKQKEFIITTLRSLGYTALMCGDGTNDVGALKHADVGVALLSNPLPVNMPSSRQTEQPKSSAVAAAATGVQNGDNRRSINDVMAERGLRNRQNVRGSQNANNARMNKLQTKMDKFLKELEEQEKSQIIKLGDASIAAPFTSKLSSIQCISHIIRQGRCTLVTTLQMFKILALNALILAYCQSVLYLDGIKFSDGQFTLQGFFLTGCFLFITRSKPMDTLSKQRPLANIFNLYTILTVLLQFAIHFISLIYLVQEAKALSPPRTEKFIDLNEEFKPTLLNTTVYIISISMQVATFAVNYKGHPFMCSLRENRLLLYTIIGSFGAVFILATGIMPEAAEKFSIVEIPDEFKPKILTTLFADLIFSFMIDRICEFFLGGKTMKTI